jgi:hypothetical protein
MYRASSKPAECTRTATQDTHQGQHTSQPTHARTKGHRSIEALWAMPAALVCVWKPLGPWHPCPPAPGTAYQLSTKAAGWWLNGQGAKRQIHS